MHRRHYSMLDGVTLPKYWGSCHPDCDMGPHLTGQPFPPPTVPSARPKFNRIQELQPPAQDSCGQIF